VKLSAYGVLAIWFALALWASLSESLRSIPSAILLTAGFVIGIRRWHMFGIAALIVSGGSGVLTSPPAMSAFPLSLVPTFLGPVMLLLHLAALAVISSASPANSPPP